MVRTADPTLWLAAYVHCAAMPNYRRAFQPGGTFFFTVVTHGRAPILCGERARRLLRQAIDACRSTHPFTIDAWILLPDHLHAIWTLPPGEADFSARWSIIKRRFTQSFLASGGEEHPISTSRALGRRRGVWQRRFWEHTLRDEDDLNAHLDYIHYNPIKHNLAACPHAWPHSSFERHVRLRHYESTWLCTCAGHATEPPSFDALPTHLME